MALLEIRQAVVFYEQITAESEARVTENQNELC